MSQSFKQTYLCVVIPLFILCFPGCSGSFQGIRVRAQSPSKEEAFRRLSLALKADGYDVQTANSESLQLVTDWRELKEKDKSEPERKSGGASLARVELRVESRGSLYDILLTPMIQSVEGEERVAEVGHPLREKWKRIVNEIVRREAREED